VPTIPVEEALDIMEDTGLAAGTLATDGRRVYAIFATGDIAAFDFKGTRLWYKNLGTPESAYGYATSLEVWQDRVLVQYDQAYAEDGKSRFYAFDGATGNVIWDVKRPVSNSWTSPMVVEVGGLYQLITVADPWTIAYDPNTGDEIWRAEAVSGDVAASPIVSGEVVVVIEPYAQSVGIRWNGQGNVTESHIAWANEDAGPDIASPVSDGQRVYLMDSQGMIYCVSATDGSLLWEHDYEEMVQASPSLVGDKLYVLAENGVMFIGTAGEDEFIQEATYALGETCLATPAFVRDRLYIRGEEHLYCIGQAEAAAPKPTTQSYATPEQLAQNWHRFRGFAGAGVTTLQDIPTQWNDANDQGILWKREIPLPGNNSPVVWENRVFLSGATEDQRMVYCMDATSGAILWSGEVPTVPVQEELDIMEDTGLCAGSLATDGVRVYAIFATGDLAAFDLEGKRLWYKNLGTPESAYGYATSLEVWQDRVLVQYDQAYAEDNKSRLYAFDGATGEIVYEKKRPVSNSWTSPIVVEVGGQYQLVTVGDPWTISYDPATGDEIWRAEAVSGDVAASPIVAGEVIVAIEPYSQSVGLRWDGKGNVTESHVAWINEDCGPDIASPVSDGLRVLLMDTQGMLFCASAKDGSLLWEHDFEEMVQASPSLVNGKLYILAENGVMFIGRYDDEVFTLETTCELGEKCFATPAFMPGRIFIRGEKSLYCIGN
ncbi:PQQ-binding-like beta-propeller repeat protein, partial [Planctomycetota bacterium]